MALGTLKLWFEPTDGIEYTDVDSNDVPTIRDAIHQRRYPVAIVNGKTTSWLIDPDRRPLQIEYETLDNDV